MGRRAARIPAPRKGEAVVARRVWRAGTLADPARVGVPGPQARTWRQDLELVAYGVLPLAFSAFGAWHFWQEGKTFLLVASCVLLVFMAVVAALLLYTVVADRAALARRKPPALLAAPRLRVRGLEGVVEVTVALEEGEEWDDLMASLGIELEAEETDLPARVDVAGPAGVIELVLPFDPTEPAAPVRIDGILGFAVAADGPPPRWKLAYEGA